MKAFARSQAFARTRLALGSLYIVLGMVVLWRTFAGVGLSWQAMPAYVLGLAMIALGAVRWRDYLTARNAR